MMTERLRNAYDLMLMSLYKIDHELRIQAKDLECHDELLQLRDEVVRYLQCERALDGDGR